MGPIQIEGTDSTTLPRDAYDLRRRRRGPPNGVCHAPWVGLHLAPDGTAAPCRFTTHTYGPYEIGSEGLGSLWTGDAVSALRERFADYRVVRDECRECVAYWEDERVLDSPAVSEFDHCSFDPEQPPTPQVLSVDGTGGVSPDLVAALEPWRKTLRQLELTLDGPMNDEIRALLQDLPRTSVCPCASRATFRTVTRFRPACARSASCTPWWQTTPARCSWNVCVHWGRRCTSDTFSSSWKCRSTATTGSTLAPGGSLRPPVTRISCPNCWHPPKRAAWRDCKRTRWRACTRCFISGASGTNATAPPMDAIRAGDRLLTRLRRWQQRAAGQDEAASDYGMPALEHPVLQQDGSALEFLAQMLRIYHDPRIEDWLRELVSAEGFADRAREHRPLRLMAMWWVSVFEHTQDLLLLQQVLGDAARANELVTQDHEALAGTAWEGWIDNWIREFNLQPSEGRGSAFPRAEPVAPDLTATPRVTVIIPSYNHADYVVGTMQSVLGQTATDFRLIVADDGSSDDTVKRAREVDDPRVTVMAHENNRGLGHNLALALQKVETPYRRGSQLRRPVPPAATRALSGGDPVPSRSAPGRHRFDPDRRRRSRTPGRCQFAGLRRQTRL